MELTLEAKLDRILGCGGRPPFDTDERSLLHAYIACLSFEELCTAVSVTISDHVDVRLALRGRLLRLLREDLHLDGLDHLVQIVEQTGSLANSEKSLRAAVDALHSALFEYLPMPTQHSILEAWIDRGTRGAAARWLKATKTVPCLFDPVVAANYWRTTKDSRAAKSLAYQADGEFLSTLLPEMVEQCEEGWIISRAVIRAAMVDESLWPLIRDKHPATYLYLCARMDRPVPDNEAFDVVCQCSASSIGESRGLAIWAIGQMRMVSVLDRIAKIAPELRERDLELIVSRSFSDVESSQFVEALDF